MYNSQDFLAVCSRFCTGATELPCRNLVRIVLSIVVVNESFFTTVVSLKLIVLRHLGTGQMKCLNTHTHNPKLHD